MSDSESERWRELCKLIQKEADPNRLIEMVTELNAILEIEEQTKTRKLHSTTNKQPTSKPSAA